MRRWRFEIALAASFVGIFAAVFLWQTPSVWRAPMSAADIDRYSAQMAANLDLPDAAKAQFIARFRAWAERDDGRPALMLNLMRYHDRLGPLPSLDFDGTPAQANAIYERGVAPLALRRGEYPVVAGEVQSANLMGYAPESDRWDRVVVMRAPDRRAFVEFIADPDYGPMTRYKTAAADVLLIPLTPQILFPDLRVMVGGILLIAFLGVSWVRALRNRSTFTDATRHPVDSTVGARPFGRS